MDISSHRYTFTFCGDCLGALSPNGTELVVDPTALINPGDIVAVLLNPAKQGPFASFVNGIGQNGFMGVCKIYLGRRELPSGEKLYLVGQLNPPVISPIPASAIEAMHKVVDGVMSEDAPEAVADDLTGVDLLLPFASDFEILPINPEWRAQ